ncbi:MAG: hypothetical protein HOY79_04445 [Streptomyces sp.]|nr:hypothetical protein [Streptomyces sp.]NUS15455.1 hypothetical protein [Streptomyces sp.]NUS24087.1 hypothetical protein [Streptomyces sp.]
MARNLNSPAVQAEVTAEYNGLPHGRITDHNGEAHVFTAGLAELEAWFMALSGHITRQPAGYGVVLWTLHTDTDHGHGSPVRVIAMALDTDFIDEDCADAIRPTAA